MTNGHLRLRFATSPSAIPKFDPLTPSPSMRTMGACTDLVVPAGMTDQPTDGPTMTLGPFRFTPTGLAIQGGMNVPLESWAAPLQFSLWCQQGAPWWIGDLLNAGDARFGEMFSQVCEGSVSADQLQRYESVARRVPAENRRPSLSWSAHAAVARLPHALQRKMLERAEQSGWTSVVLQRKVRDEIERRRRAGRALSDEPDDTMSGPSPDEIEPYEL